MNIDDKIVELKKEVDLNEAYIKEMKAKIVECNRSVRKLEGIKEQLAELIL